MPDQLKMRRLAYEDLPALSLPAGYRLRSYQSGDEAVWAEIINRAGQLGQQTPEKVRAGLTGQDRFHPEGLLFVTTEDGEPVATACAWLSAKDDWRAGQVHMVAVVPEHQGKRLSYWASIAVCQVFRSWGVPEIFLLSDEFRKAAVKVYINLGFRPIIRSKEHYDRWIHVFRSYGLEEQAALLREERERPGAW